MRPCGKCCYGTLCSVHGFDDAIYKVIFHRARQQVEKARPGDAVSEDDIANVVLNNILDRRHPDCPEEVD